MDGKDGLTGEDLAVLARVARGYNRYASERRRVKEIRLVQEHLAETTRKLQELWVLCAKRFEVERDKALAKGLDMRRVGSDEDGEWMVTLHVLGESEYPLWLGRLLIVADAVNHLHVGEDGALQIDAPKPRLAETS